MEEEQAAHHLLNVLEERGLTVDLDKILLGFEDEHIKQEAATWVQEYLNEDTLLTREELELYRTLRKKGLLHQYESEEEPIRPILDHEISTAIDSLQTSTAAIEEQCKILEAQKDALMKLKALDRVNLDVEHARNERRRKEGQEKGKLDVTVEDMSTSLLEQLSDSQREIDAEKSTIKSYLAERFSSDDQILNRLPGIVAQIVAEPKAAQDDKSIAQWCKAIISFRAAEIKARVDTVYLKSLRAENSKDATSESGDDLEDRKIALKTELETLHQEIASIAEMVVEHEIRQPMMDMRERREREKVQTRAAWLDYVLSTLDYMDKRLQTVTSISSDVDQFQQALAHVNNAATKRLLNRHAAAPTPAARRMTASNSAFTPMVKLRPTKNLDLPASLQDALRHAGISYNHAGIESLQDSLIASQLQRQKKLHDHYATACTSAHNSLAERSYQADRDAKNIAGILYRHTPFRTVRLSSPALERELSTMDRQLEVKGRELLEAERNELSLSDPKVRAFTAKYGR